MFNRNFSQISFFVLAALTPACGGSPVDGQAVGETHDGLSTISETVVTFEADGAKKVVVNYLTREEADARDEARRQFMAHTQDGVGTQGQGLGQDAGCSPSALWVYDHTGESGNRICFIGAGIGSLYDYCYASFRGTCYDTWAGHMRSIWAGSSTGYTFNRELCASHFAAWERRDLVGCQIDNVSVELDSN
jgi:hypothetical protein